MSLADDAEIRGLFVDESLEALMRVEGLLLEAEQGTSSGAPVDVMFRDMHTIKGTAGLLGYERTTSLSHAAEDLMSQLRDRGGAGDAQAFALMVDVVDHLRGYVERVRDVGDEGTRDPAPLIARLRQFVDTAGAAETIEEPPRARTSPGISDVEDDDDETPTFRRKVPARVDAEVAPKINESDSTVRVNVAVLDTLMNLMGELVLSRNQMVQLVKSHRDPTAQAVAQRLSLVTAELQNQIMKTRMQPVARVFEKIPRQVRDLCQQLGKKVTVALDGTTTELDKALVEAIRDPVMHIVRNAIDHGFEAPAERVRAGKPADGRLQVRAYHQGSTVSIEVRDDGRGIDPSAVKRVAIRRGIITVPEADRLTDREAIELIFRPGFSTAETVTNISGRGVGMDVVRSHVERAGGHVELESELTRGTTIRMKMPLTLAIIPALLVQEGGQHFAIPQANLLELVHLDEVQSKRQIETVRGVPVYRLRGEILPIVRLGPLLQRPPFESSGMNIVVVSVGQRRYGLAVETINDTEEIVIKPLHAALKRLSVYAGATVLGDGSVALILDVGGVAQQAGIDLINRSDRPEGASLVARTTHQPMLVFQAGAETRCAVPVSMVARLEQVDTSTIERSGGREVLQYRGSVMPIIRAEQAMPIEPSVAWPPTQQMLVFNFGQPVGLAVDSILDAAEVSTVHASTLPHTLGQAVIGGRTTLLVDIFSLVRTLAPECLKAEVAHEKRPRLLLSDDSDTMRGALASFLRAAGFEVAEARADVALRDLRAGHFNYDAVVAGLEPSSRAFEFLETLQDAQPRMPFWCVGPADSRTHAEAAGARAWFSRLDREGLRDALRPLQEAA